MAVAKECTDSTHEVSRGEVASSVNTSCGRKKEAEETEELRNRAEI